MPEYLAPGVYVEEIEIGAKPIEGVSTSTAGFIGETERGPVEARYITSFEEYSRIYGGYDWSSSRETSHHLPYAVNGFFRNGGKRCFIARVLGNNDKIAQYPAVALSKPSRKETPKSGESDTDSATTKEDVLVKTEAPSTAGNNPGPHFQILAKDPGEWGNRVEIEIRASNAYEGLFDLSVKYWSDEEAMEGDPDFREDFPDLSPLPKNPRFYERQVNNASKLIELKPDLDVEAWEIPKKKDEVAVRRLGGGKDGDDIQLINYKGSPDLDARTGLAALAAIDEISILCAPDETTVADLRGELVGQCEALKDRFAVLQAPENSKEKNELRPPKDTKYAAYYYPWIWVRNPNTGDLVKVPPGGHIAGVYARSDTERGVHKAPANETLRGVSKLEFELTRGDQELLNPRGVNCIRTFPGRGIRVWGARTMSSDTLWKYVNVRRLFLYLEESIDEGTQWVVFEPNDHRLWARVRQSVSDFLTRVWRDGALMGRTAEEAFFVKCDETTMTNDDIENGRLVVLVGVAPVRPAEFVIFRIAQWRSGSDISE